jgi:hypothetical protein
MKTKLCTKILAVSAIGFASIATINQSSYAQTNTQTTTYFCGASKDGVPTTFTHSSTGRKIAIIRWEKKWSSEYTPEVRCQEVSSRFQSASEEGVLNYLTAGMIKGRTVLCAARRYGDTCSYLLLTLKPGDDASQVIETLRQIGYKATGPLVQSEDGSPRMYIDMNKLRN